MSAEGKPHIESSLFAKPLGFVTRLILQQPRFVVITSLVLAVVCVVLAATQLGFRNNRLDLLNPKSHYNQRWLSYLNEFGEEDDVVVVVEAPDQGTVIRAVDELALVISREHRHFHSVLYKNEPSRFRGKGLHYLDSDQLQEIEQTLFQLQPALEGNWSRVNVNSLLEQYNNQLEFSPSDQTTQGIARFATTLSYMLSDSPRYHSPWAKLATSQEELQGAEPEYFLSKNGKLGFLSLRIQDDGNRFAQGGQAIARLREIIGEFEADRPDVVVGLTGMPILENDEMRTSQSDMTRTSILSLFAVACLFVAGFGGLRHPLMTVAALIVAMAWAFGFATIAVGHLNILSISFGVILIGLGIDFGIHYVAKYLHFRNQGKTVRAALIATASRVGPGIITGGVTTALAFATAALTPFTGVAELGIIAGGGILICVIGTLVLLPALLLLAETTRRTPRSIPEPIPVHLFAKPATKFPRLTLGLSVALTIAVGFFALRVRIDHNLLNLQADSLQSTKLERRLLEETDRSVWFAISMARNPAELRQLKAEFQQLDCVGRVEEVVTKCLPEEDAEKLARVQAIAARVQELPPRPPEIPISSLEELDRALERANRVLQKRQSYAMVTSPLFIEPNRAAVNPRRSAEGTLVDLVRLIRLRLRSLSAGEYYRLVAQLQRHLAIDLHGVLQQIHDSADPAPPRLDDLPAAIHDRFVGQNERLLLKVYAKGDVWDMDQLKHFVSELERKDPNITGHPVQTYYASREMQRSYFHAGIYALLAVLIVLVLDFRSIQYALLALIPVAIGMLQMFGLMGLFGIPLNPANLIVLPLILGIGIDDGVHVIHDFRNQAGRYRIGRSTATAVLITSATTIAGFGMMMFSRHQGLRSLGQVLTLGVFCCMLTSIFVLPALLAFLARNRASEETSAGDSPDLLPLEGDDEVMDELVDEPPPAVLRRAA